MRLVFLSDTHCQMDMIKYKVPDGDVLIHCGDWTYSGTVKEFMKEIDIFNMLPHEHKILCVGNHERFAERLGIRFVQELCEPSIVLHNESAVINDVKFYGSASTKWFHNWAFNIRGYDNLTKEWKQIDEDTDILFTHGPPFGQLDKAVFEGQNLGDEALWTRVQHLPELRIHAFGHIHGSAQVKYNYSLDKFFVNASICNEQYYPNNWPIVMDYDPITKQVQHISGPDKPDSIPLSK